MIIICLGGSIRKHSNGGNNENVREDVWIIAFMKRSMLLRPQGEGENPYDTEKWLHAGSERSVLYYFSLLITSAAIDIEIYLTRIERSTHQRSESCTVERHSAACDAFVSECRFMVSWIAIWNVLRLRRLERRERLFLQRLYDEHWTHLGIKISRTMCDSCILLSGAARSQIKSRNCR